MPSRVEAGFHGIASFELETEDAEAAEFFAAEYAHSPPGDTPSPAHVKLKWSRSAIPRSPGPGYRLHVHKALARWYYRLNWSPGRLEIDAHGNRMAISMVHHMLVHHGLRYLCSLQGVLMFHAAAVALEGKSVVLTGEGGMGKTTTSSLLLAAGRSDWQLHADDYVFIDADGRTLSYLTRSHMYRDLLQWLPDLASRLSPGERIRLFFLGLLRDLTSNNVTLPVRLPTHRLWPTRSVAQQARLDSFVVLERSPVDELQLTELQSHEVPLEALMRMSHFEARHFKRLVEKAGSYPMRAGWWETWDERERDQLRTTLSRIPTYRLDVPEGPIVRPESAERLSKLFESLLLSRAAPTRHG